MHSVIRAAFFISIGLSNAYAEDLCNSSVGQDFPTVQPSVLWRNLAQVPTLKDEYETTASFQNRVAKIMGPEQAFAVEIDTSPEFMRYDADSSTLHLQSYYFMNRTTDYRNVFGYGTPLYNKVSYGIHNAAVVFPFEEKNAGSYVGVTPFGIKMKVTKIKRLTRVIFERDLGREDSLFLKKGPHDSPIISIPMSSEQARVLKRDGRAAFVYLPKAPYFTTGTYPWGEPSLQNPQEIDERLEVAIGDIQCAVMLSPDSKVLAIVPTR